MLLNYLDNKYGNLEDLIIIAKDYIVITESEIIKKIKIRFITIK